MSDISGAWDYADRVVSGREYACPKIVAVCQRHLDCLELWERGQYWCRFDERRGALPGALAEGLLNVKDARGKRVPFKMLPWQRFMTASWNGWVIDQRHKRDPMFRQEGTRRFRRVFLLSGRGSGKTPVAVVFILMAMFEERDAVCMCAAKTEDQARRPWEEFGRMMRADETGILEAMLEFVGGQRLGDAALIRSKDPRSASRFQCIGSQTNAGQFSGLIPSLIIGEELCFHANDDVMNILDGGTKNRSQPTTLLLTNAGTFRSLVARDEYLRAQRMCEGTLPWRDDLLPLVYEVPEERIGIAMERDETGAFSAAARKEWKLANPSIGEGGVGEDFIAKELEDGLLSDASMEDVKRQIFSYWPVSLGSGNYWIDYRRLEVLEGPRPSEEVLEKADVYCGLDLGDTRDFSALAIVWKLESGELYIEVRHYTPADTVDARGKKGDVPLGTWARTCLDASCTAHSCDHRKVIETCPGSTTDYAMIADDILELLETCGGRFRGLAFDRKFMYRVHDELQRIDANLKFSRRGDAGRERSGCGAVDHVPHRPPSGRCMVERREQAGHGPEHGSRREAGRGWDGQIRAESVFAVADDMHDRENQRAEEQRAQVHGRGRRAEERHRME